MRLRRRTPRAGRQADDWFEETFRDWQRQIRPRFALAVLPALALFGTLALLWPVYRQFYAGLAVGCVLTMYLCILDSPPEWIERKRRGRDGERRTERELQPLEREGWVIAHDLRASRGNHDHVVVGPGGAFLLDSKALRGEVAFDSGGMVVRRSKRSRDDWRPHLAGSARGAAAEMRRQLAAAGVRWVTPVVVLWTDFPEGVREVEGVAFVHGAELTDWLRTGRGALPGPTVEQVRTELQELERESRQTIAA